ncbi:hypothetical protein [Methanogenium cariaci]|uniref:hypothetical protein n=1 Tax=Methanogenium cariaci TaxID=2197 RepID=UPI001FDFAFB9|nr:hypothetical protein [Methanogenium cariaci]
MTDEKITVGGKEFVCSVIPAGPVNIVFAANEGGLVGCGAIDVTALSGFGYAAARIRPPEGAGIGGNRRRSPPGGNH